MPELPEVETVARAVHKRSQGAFCERIIFHRDSLRYPIAKAEIEVILLNQPLQSVTRRGKYIICKTDKGFVIIHLGMSGRLLFADDPTPIRPHTHVVFGWRDAVSHELHYWHYVDPRRFGMIEAAVSLDLFKPFQEMGVEPLSTPDLAKTLYELTRDKSIPIKTFLLNQENIAGVGNIYACEALFLAQIHPLRVSSSLSKRDCQGLASSLQNVLNSALEAGGTTFRDYRSANGDLGYFAVSLRVYARKGEPCPNCGTQVQEIRIGGRSTFFCDKCQKQ